MTQRRYEKLWHAACRGQAELLADPAIRPFLLEFATPVLVFGRWQTATFVTAGLNPSEREFCDAGGAELAPADRRLAHRSPSDARAPDVPAVMKAATAYFETPSAYWTWFGGFQPLLDSLGASYASGSACHTDYLSPYATRTGAGAIPHHVIRLLQQPGLLLWKSVIELLPSVRTIIGIGRGWRLMPGTFGFQEWTPVETSFDRKGSRSNIRTPYLLERAIDVASRPVALFWWKPNRGEPLGWLSNDEKRALGAIIHGRMKRLA